MVRLEQSISLLAPNVLAAAAAAARSPSGDTSALLLASAAARLYPARNGAGTSNSGGASNGGGGGGGGLSRRSSASASASSLGIAGGKRSLSEWQLQRMGTPMLEAPAAPSAASVHADMYGPKTAIKQKKSTKIRLEFVWPVR